MKNKLTAMPATYAIMLVWLVVWILTLTGENVADALCGKGIATIGNEYYRFLTACLVHTDAVHLAVNISALFWTGLLYEQKTGSLRFLAVGAVCAVLAQVAFLCIFRTAEGSMGGSPPVYALCGFGITLRRFIPDFPKIEFGTGSGNWLIIYLIAANVPLLSFMDITTPVIHAIAFGLGVLSALAMRYSGLLATGNNAKLR